jgi:selenocysteine lyase/cysteine desulfurase
MLWKRALARWSEYSHARRLPIVSLRIRAGERYLHHNYVVAVLNDLFGIQARGGCSCAGPYGHRLLAIDTTRSAAFRDEISHGCEGIKPGWIRINFNYFISDTVADYLAEAISLLGPAGLGGKPGRLPE